MTQIKKSLFARLSKNRLIAMAKVFGPEKIISELEKAGVKKFDLTPANVDPERKPEFENKEVFDGAKYHNAAPGEREIITETSQDIDNSESDANNATTKDEGDPDDPIEESDEEEELPEEGKKPTSGKNLPAKKNTADAVKTKKPKPNQAPEEVDDEESVAKEWGKEIRIKKAYANKRIVIGALYIPYDPADESTIDSHGHACLAEDIEEAAYEFMRKMNLYNVDMQHNFIADYGYVVESYIAKSGDPLFKEGTWVVGVKVTSEDVWSKIESGEITGFSLAGHAHLRPPEEVL